MLDPQISTDPEQKLQEFKTDQTFELAELPASQFDFSSLNSSPPDSLSEPEQQAAIPLDTIEVDGRPLVVTEDSFTALSSYRSSNAIELSQLQSTELGVAREYLANWADGRIGGSVSWGRCAAIVNSTVRNSPGSADISTVDYDAATHKYWAIDYARSMRDNPDWIQVTGPGGRLLTPEEAQEIPGAVVFFQKPGHSVDDALTRGSYPGHVGIMSRNGTLVTDGYFPGRVNAYGPDSQLGAELHVFIPVPTQAANEVYVGTPPATLTAQQADSYHIGIQDGTYRGVGPGDSSEIVLYSVAQQNYVVEQLQERYGGGGGELAELVNNLPTVTASANYDEVAQSVNQFREAFGLGEGTIDQDYRDVMHSLLTTAIGRQSPEDLARFPSTENALEFAESWTMVADAGLAPVLLASKTNIAMVQEPPQATQVAANLEPNHTEKLLIEALGMFENDPSAAFSLGDESPAGMDSLRAIIGTEASTEITEEDLDAISELTGQQVEAIDLQTIEKIGQAILLREQGVEI